MFVTTFGMKRQTYREQPGLRRCPSPVVCPSIADIYTAVANNPNRIIWVEGDLSLTADLGTPAAPVLLIVNGERLTLGADVDIHGFVYMTGGLSADSTIELPDTPTSITGAVVAEGRLLTTYPGVPVPNTASRLTVTYDRAILELLRTTYGSWVRLPGRLARFQRPARAMNTFVKRLSRGVSLIEALVALAVMAIGMLGIVGVQSTLRSTSDMAKQRSEATRIAQAEIELWRGFLTLNSGGAATDYDDLSDTGGLWVNLATVNGINATYTPRRSVLLLPAPRVGKALSVSVTWNDRSGQQQRVDMSTLIAGISPEVGATLALPAAGDVIQQARGRKGGIPFGAKDLGGGRSGWIPPGSGTGVAWIFNNITGVITVCTTTAATTADLIYDPGTPGSNNVVCSNTDPALYVSGYVRYALGTAQPTPANAVNPPSRPSDPPSLDQVTVAVEYIQSGFWLTKACYVRHVNPASASAPAYTEFNCAVPALVIPFVPLSWSGNLSFGGPTGLISSTASDAAATSMKVCRYHAAASYGAQRDPLSNQNFLMIRSGDGAPTTPTAYTCPTPLYAHQPP